MKVNEKDKIWALTVKLRADFKCELCGWDGDKLDAHHIIPRTFSDIRYNAMNGIALCSSCHKLGSRAPHRPDGNSVFFFFLLMKKYPDRFKFVEDYIVKRIR